MSHVEGWQEVQGRGWEKEREATPEGRASGIMHPRVGNGIMLQLPPLPPPGTPLLKSGIGANGKNIPYVLISSNLIIMLCLAMQLSVNETWCWSK